MRQPFEHTIASGSGSGIPIQIQAALIAALVSLLTISLGEVFLRMRTRRTAKQAIRETYQKYADPLALSSTDLFWRLREVFEASGAGFYLKGHAHLAKYEHYKALSTLYRLGNLLGWIRALRRELLFLPRTNPEEVAKLELALRRFTSALAEGGHVESQRVRSLTRLWGIGEDASPDAIRRAGIQIDWRFKNFLHEKSASSASDLSDSDALELSQKIADAMTAAFGCKSVAKRVISETLNRAMTYLSVREAWVYRDWQAAIGDVMLRETQPGVRFFEVIGYKDFETLCLEGREGDRTWMRRLNAVIDDLDIHGDRSEDARIEQLRTVYIATAEIIRALHLVDPKKSMITADTFSAASAILSAGQS